ncbi:ABC-type uncharacterized transport system substrate-binding protein [Nitrobacteraceae bacterium AZCC 1564]
MAPMAPSPVCAMHGPSTTCFRPTRCKGSRARQRGLTRGKSSRRWPRPNVESLKEYAYFTFAKIGPKGSQKKEKFGDPVDYYLEYKDAALTLHFTLPFKTPFKANTLAVEVFDPSYFIDFTLNDKDPVKLVDAPANCKLSIDRPTDGSAQAQTMNEQSFLNGDNSNYGAMFANKIMVDCP